MKRTEFFYELDFDGSFLLVKFYAKIYQSIALLIPQYDDKRYFSQVKFLPAKFKEKGSTVKQFLINNRGGGLLKFTGNQTDEMKLEKSSYRYTNLNATKSGISFGIRNAIPLILRETGDNISHTFFNNSKKYYLCIGGIGVIEPGGASKTFTTKNPEDQYTPIISISKTYAKLSSNFFVTGLSENKSLINYSHRMYKKFKCVNSSYYDNKYGSSEPPYVLCFGIRSPKCGSYNPECYNNSDSFGAIVFDPSRHVISHELMHHRILNCSNANKALWYTEGMTEFLSAKLGTTAKQFDIFLKKTALIYHTNPLKNVPYYSEQYKIRPDIEFLAHTTQYYIKGFLFAHFLSERDGFDTLISNINKNKTQTTLTSELICKNLNCHKEYKKYILNGETIPILERPKITHLEEFNLMHLLRTGEFINVSPQFKHIIRDTAIWSIRVGHTDASSKDDAHFYMKFETKNESVIAVIDFLEDI